MSEIENKFYDLMSEFKVYPNKKNLTIHLNKTFKETNFLGKSVSDIGGGSGLHSFYAFVKGASLVDCVEPESDGSSNNMKKNFFKIKENLKAESVNFFSKTFQDFKSEDEKYDYILTYNVINHLDEKASKDLKNIENKEIFEKIFKKFFRLLKPSGKILVADCTNKNFYDDLNLTNPFAKSINWEIHQDPSVWIEMLEAQGFKIASLKWSTFNSLGVIGRYLFENKLAAYLTFSHFYFWMEKEQ